MTTVATKLPQPIRSTIPAGWTGCAGRRSTPGWCSGSAPPGSWTAGMIYFYATRFIAGSGIGGEYSAVNSAIDEMMPARYRGRTDIWINGSYWLGSIIGTLAAFLLLNSLPENTGWNPGCG